MLIVEIVQDIVRYVSQIWNVPVHFTLVDPNYELLRSLVIFHESSFV